MLAFLFLICGIYLSGNWSNSSPKSETEIFFKEVEPDLIPKVQPILEKLKDDEHSILQGLANVVPQPVFGLLNLSLAIRYFHPKAAIENPLPGQPKLRGWSAVFDFDVINKNAYKDAHKRWVSVYHEKSQEQRWDFLMDAVTDFKDKVWKSVSSKVPNQTVLEPFNSSYPLYKTSSINGRTTKHGPFNILHALIEEYKFLRFFNFSKNALTLQSSREIRHWLPYPTGAPKLEGHDWSRRYAEWSELPSFESSDPMTVLRCKKPLSVVHIYFDLKSPESPALLEWAAELALANKPINIYLILVADMTNVTEKRIAYAWIHSVRTLNVRNACLMMIDGFVKGFKRAYKATLPSVKWRNLLKENDKSDVENNFMNHQNFVKKWNIQAPAVSINGEFIQKRPIFQSVDAELRAVVGHWKKATQEKEIVWTAKTDLDAWNRDHSMHWNSSVFPLEIGKQHRISMNGFNLDVVKSVADRLGAVAKSSNGIPVVKSDVLRRIAFSEKEEQLLRLTKTKTVVGCLLFDRELTDVELAYATSYAKFVFCVDNLEKNLTQPQLLMCLFMRSTLDLQNDIRKPLPSKLNVQPFGVKKQGYNGLTWAIIDDIFDPEARRDLVFSKYVAESGAASVLVYPVINFRTYASCPSAFWSRVVPIVGIDSIEMATGSKSYSLSTPNEWIFVNHLPLVVQKVISYGFCDTDSVIKIGDIERVPTKDCKYFQVMLPIGEYTTQGLKSPSFAVDSFVSVPRFYEYGDKAIQPSRDNTLHLLTFMTDSSRKSSIMTMLYTVTQNTTAKIKLWLVDNTKTARIPDCVDGEVLPCYFPYVYDSPGNMIQSLKCWKFALMDVYLPPNAQVLFLDQSVIMNGDASRFQRLDMSGVVAAAPIMTVTWQNKANCKWTERGMRLARMDRPFHTTSVVYIDTENWRKAGAGCLFRQMVSEYVHAGMDVSDEPMFNIMQLKMQILSLPEEVAYCNTRSPEKLAKKALAVVLCSSESARLSGIRLERTKELAQQKYKM